jgi:hypothetical protein
LTDSDSRTIETLRHIGFSDIDELRTQLESEGPNMAKVFFSMLTSTMPWQLDVAAPRPPIGEVDEANDAHPAIPRESSMDSLSGSLSESLRQASRYPAVSSVEGCDQAAIGGLETDASALLTILQRFFRERGLAFLHPDDRTLIVVNGDGAQTHRLRAVYCADRRMLLDIRLLALDEQAGFSAFSAGLRAAVRDLIRQPTPD